MRDPRGVGRTLTPSSSYPVVTRSEGALCVYETESASGVFLLTSYTKAKPARVLQVSAEDHLQTQSVLLWFAAMVRQGIRPLLEQSGDADRRQGELTLGDLLRPRVQVWRWGKGYHRLILDVDRLDDNTPRRIPSAIVSGVLH